MTPNQFLHDVLNTGLIAFSVDDLAGLEKVGLPKTNDLFLCPRPKYPTEPGVLCFTTKSYRNKNNKEDTLTEEQYRNLTAVSKQRYAPYYLIHLTKAAWDSYQHNAPFLAQIVVDVYNQLFPDKAVDVHSLWSDRAKANGVSDVDFFFVEHAERMKNVEYLRKLADGVSKDEDPHGNMARAAREALRRLGS